MKPERARVRKDEPMTTYTIISRGEPLCLEHVDVMVRPVWNPAEFADRIGFEALATLAGGYAEAVEALEQLKSLLAAALAAAPRLKQRGGVGATASRD